MLNPLHRITTAAGDVAPRPAASPDEHVSALRIYLDIVLRGRWTILAFVASALVVSGLYLFLAPPKYESDVLLQVEERGRGLLGQIDDVPGLLPTQTPADTEIEILRSRSLVGSVVDELRLDIDARPRFFPLFGAAVARWRDAPKPASSLFGLSRFAWGGERIQVTRLELPKALEGKRLSLVPVGAGAFELDGPGGRILSGQVGKPSRAGTAEREEPASIFVAELTGREETPFRLVKKPRNKVIQELQRQLVIAEQGRKTGVLRVSLTGTDPDRIRSTLDALARTYLRQNVERRSEEAEKTLEFVTTQLPVLKAKVEAAEAALSDYRSQNGAAVDVSLETKSILDRSSEIEKRISELALERAELQQRFTETHPTILALRQKEAKLEAERSAVNAQMKNLPDAELASVRLMRDVKVANELYVLLLNKAQELRVMKSGTIGNVRILDSAMVPDEPSSPRVASVLSLGLLVGLVAGVAGAFARRTLNLGVEDPAVIEREIGLSVHASIPHTDNQVDVGRASRRAQVPLLARATPADPAVESLRSLRTSLQFALSEAGNNIVAVVGPGPSIGKSFVVANLAQVLSDGGKRVLVIDGDLRKGRQHQYFGLERSPGLSEAICGEATIDEGIHSTSTPRLQVIPSGKPPPNPAELLSSQRFADLVNTLAPRFDVVLVDTAPILAVTDAALVGSLAGTTLLVLRAGQHPLREISLAVKTLAQNHVRAHAIVLNDVRNVIGNGRYGYGHHYQYTYK